MATSIDDIRRNIRPEDVVVSVDAIIESLRGKVSEEVVLGVVNDLLLSVLASSRTEVRPGELITADFMNGILAQIESLTTRVTTLEANLPGNNQLIILELIPPGVLRIGQELQIVGRNFGFSSGAHRVLIDDIQVTSFNTAQSSDQKLVFNIPVVPVPQDGKVVALTVSNGVQSAQRIFTLLPASTTQRGDVTVSFISVEPTTITSNSPNPVTFQYNLRSRALLPASFLITPTISGIANQSEWNNRLQVLDNLRNPISDKRIQLEPDRDTTFFIRLISVPAVPAGSTSFTLRTEAAAEGVNTGVEGPRSFPIGTTIPPEDTSFSLLSTFAEPPSALVGTTIKLAANGEVLLTLNLRFTQAGDYRLDPVLVEGNGWTANPSPSVQNPIPVPNVPKTEAAEFVIRAQPTASNSGRVELRVQRVGATSRRTFPFTLSRQ